jgi:GNAT superfamily N-acetyltransferase
MRLRSKNAYVDVRDATVADVPLLLQFIRSMAAFERLPVSATEQTLRSALFGDAPAARAILAFVDGRPVGYATYFFTFATMTGRRGLWLDDVYLDVDHRGKGIGQALMAYLADLAVRSDCARFEWMVLDRNEPALAFYRRLGVTVLSDWRICRLEGAEIASLAGTVEIRGRQCIRERQNIWRMPSRYLDRATSPSSKCSRSPASHGLMVG